MAFKQLLATIRGPYSQPALVCFPILPSTSGLPFAGDRTIPQSGDRLLVLSQKGLVGLVMADSEG